MGRVGLILRGGVSRKGGKIELTNFDNDYVNFECVFNSIKKHIVDVNPNYEFDFFIHSWSYNIKDELNQLYKPVISEYEDNSTYYEKISEKLRDCNSKNNNFSSVSESLSISKSCKLFDDYVKSNLIEYDFVILYRPDVLIWEDLYLSDYSKENIYCNSFLEGNGDFHFIFDSKKIYGFLDLFDKISKFNLPIPHQYIKYHLTTYHNFNVINDNIIAGLHQEAVRKLKLLEINKEFLTEYGISLDEINSYVP